MNRPLRTPFKKSMALIVSATTVTATAPVRAEQRLKPGTPLYLETKVKKGKQARVRVKDKETGKQASLILSPSANRQKASGQFILQFDNDKGPDLELLDFSENGHKLSTFAPQPDSQNIHHVYLFSSPTEKEKFSETFETEKIYTRPKSSAEPPPTALKNPPTQLPQEVKPLEIPKELPKIQALQTKKAEEQKKENEIKVNIEATEAQKRAERLEQLAKMKEQEKAQRKEQARKTAEKAQQHYQKGEYKDAADLFAEATRLDPETDTYYFQYGVSLYKIENYKKSLALLSIAEGNETNKTELRYFKGLNHMKLQEYDQAQDEFTEVEEENDPNVSAPASFYAGSIAYRKENYESARKHLEYTIDNSKDPKVDQQAEDLLEEIDRREAFLNRTKEQFKYSLTAGFGYDSNVLNTALQNLASNAEALRFNYGGNFLYRFLYDYQNEFSGEVSLNDMYSMTPSFQPDATLQSADPLVLSASLPYHRQSLLGKRVVNWGFTPQYQSISMSLDNKERKQILSSMIGKFDANFMLNSEWMSSYRFEYSADTSSIAAATPDDNLSGTRMAVGTTQTKLLNQRGTNTWNYSLDYTMNQAEGNNYKYNKIGLGVGYTDKIFHEHDGTLRLDFASQTYPQATSGRADTLGALSASLGKEYWPSTYLTYSTQFNANSSNVPAYRYDRVVLNVSITYLGSHKKK
ncbi:MAG: tetratricopeptide repeat protein [Bdellovibrio sp.]